MIFLFRADESEFWFSFVLHFFTKVLLEIVEALDSIILFFISLTTQVANLKQSPYYDPHAQPKYKYHTDHSAYSYTDSSNK